MSELNNISTNLEYEVKIVDSSKELTKREKIAFTQFQGMEEIGKCINDVDTETGEIKPRIITPLNYVVADVHNEKARGNKDYRIYIIVDDGGVFYKTSSVNFWNAFKNIWDLMEGQDLEDLWQIRLLSLPSQNYETNFLSCTIVNI